MENYSVSLFLRKDFEKKDGTKPIYLLVHINNEVKKYSVGISAKEIHWNNSRKKILTGDIEHLKKNLALDSKLKKANDIIFNSKVKSELLTMKEFDMLFTHKNAIAKQKKDVNSFIEFALAEIERDYQNDGSYDTHRTRKSGIKKIKKFAGKDLSFEDIDYNFIKNITGDMIKKGQSESSQARIQKLIKTMFNRAIVSGLTEKNPMTGFKIKERYGTREYLTGEEVKKLVQLFENPNTEKTVKKALRVFLFCCYTGLRYRDIFELRFKNIISSVENGVEKHKLKFIMHKTKDWHEVPLNINALSLLPDRTFDEARVFNVYSNQPMNRYIKKAIKEAKIKKKISFHCSRHTFATLLLRMGVPITTVSKLLGHKDLKTTMIYARILPESKEEAVTLLDEILK